MGAGRGWLRWLIGAGSTVAVLLMLGLVVVLVTDVGTPSSRYAHESVPHVCELVHEPTVRALAGEVTLSPGVASGPGDSQGGLTPDTAVSTCSDSSEDASHGTVQASAYLFSSAQFHLGQSGEEQASDMLATQEDTMRSSYPGGCGYERGDPADVCGMYDGDGAILYVQHENVFVEIRFHSFQESLREAGQDPGDPGEQPVEDMEERMAALTEEALSQLTEVGQ